MPLRNIASLLLAVSIVPLVGCACLDRPYTPLTHADSWDPVLGSCGSCGVCEGGCGGHTPGSYLRHKLTCGSGCGDIYWGEWLSDPPDPCDPCDDCGNWTGPTGCCPPRLWERVASGWCNLWGHRSGCSSCGQLSGCSGCGVGGGGKGGGTVLMKGEPIEAPVLHHTSQQEPTASSLLRSARFTSE